MTKRNDRMMNSADTEFVRNHAASTAWVNAISAGLMLPGLRGYWPASSCSAADAWRDLSGNGLDLAQNGTAGFGWMGLAPMAKMLGRTKYFNRADTNLNITNLGITVGGWFWLNSLNGASNDGFIGKYNGTGNQKSYILYTPTPSPAQAVFGVSGSGSNFFNVGTTSLITASRWWFIAGRWTASTEVAVWLNDEKDTNTVNIPATVFSSTADFEIGAFNGGSNPMDGYASLCFLSRFALDDAIVMSYYHQTRALFGV